MFAVNPKDNTRPFNDNCNVTISQRAPLNSVAEIAYVGSRTRFMNHTENYLASNNNYALANINLITPGSLFRPDPITGAAPNPAGTVTSDYRPFPLYNQVNLLNNNLWANHNAFQASDLSVQRNITIRERQTVQLRFSAFNFLNHPLWTFNPNNNTDRVLQYNASVAGQPATNANSQFGFVSYKSCPLGSAAPNWVVEFTLKYMF